MHGPSGENAVCFDDTVGPLSKNDPWCPEGWWLDPRRVRVALSLGASRRVDRWRLVIERAVPSPVVVVVLPVGDHDAGVGQGPEDVDVQAFVADSGVERLDVAVAAPARQAG